MMCLQWRAIALLHTDLNPCNLLITSDERVYVVDGRSPFRPDVHDVA